MRRISWQSLVGMVVAGLVLVGLVALTGPHGEDEPCSPMINVCFR